MASGPAAVGVFMRCAMRPGLVEILEACYRPEGDLDQWVKSVGETVDAHLGLGCPPERLVERYTERQRAAASTRTS